MSAVPGALPAASAERLPALRGSALRRLAWGHPRDGPSGAAEAPP